MNRINCFLICLFFTFTATTSFAQNFDETWKEFLENNKISNMSRLPRPNAVTDQINYAKYLLMSTNNNFCQSKIEKAETMIAELQEIDTDIHESIPGFTPKMDDLGEKIKAYHEIDKIWNRFLKTKEVTVEELEDIFPPSTICEKRTLVKYSYMTAHSQLCEGDVERSKNTFEKRTLKIAEKTTLRVKDVRGLAPEVRKMKTLYTNIPKLNDAWDEYVETGESPGFDKELPVFPCYPIPNIKAYILRGSADICNSGADMLDKIKKLQEEITVVPDRALRKKINELEEAIEENDENAAPLNKAWNTFIKNNKVPKSEYGYEYCNKESLIRAYILDGFAYPCNMADESLEKIEALLRSDVKSLKKITKTKINELAGLTDTYEENGVEIEDLWRKFVSQGDTLYSDYISTDQHCDNIHHVKDWTMKGLSATTCKEGLFYLEKIEEFNRTFDFDFYKELECRVTKLRIRVWDCRYEAFSNLAKLETAPDPYEDRLNELLEEYGMEKVRPEDCSKE